MSTLHDILPPKARKVVYATLGIVVPTTTVAVATLANGWQWADLPVIAASVAASAGFGLATANTNTGV